MFAKYDIVYGIVTSGEGSPLPKASYTQVVRLLVLGSSYSSGEGWKTYVTWHPSVGGHYSTWHKKNADMFRTEEEAERELFKRKLKSND